MKTWNGYASEHSNNLVMIGTFKKAADAREATRAIDELTRQVSGENGAYSSDAPVHRYSEAMLDLMSRLRIHSLLPTELGQFEFEVHIESTDDRIQMTTQEIDISAFLKVLIEKGARVEVYSAHDYPVEKRA